MSSEKSKQNQQHLKGTCHSKAPRNMLKDALSVDIRLVAKFSGHFWISDISDFNGILNFLERYLGSGGVPLDSSWS